MFPELHDGDRLILDRTAYHGRKPKRGEVIVFKKPGETSKLLVKRVIGIPGDHVEIGEGKVKVNENVLEDDYTMSGTTPGEVDTVVPEGKYFVLGDNRENSSDSRSESVGLVPEELIEGKVAFRAYPPGRVFTRSGETDGEA